LEQADGYDIALRSEPLAVEEKLCYVNLGGYDKTKFLELHQNVFVVAKSVAEAKSRAIKHAKGWHAAHRDEMYEAEQAFCLDKTAEENRLHIHLTPAAMMPPLTFSCDYKPLR
jgi:hypothetical protein